MNTIPFRLYLISDRTRMGSDPAGAVAELVRAGLGALQWREKDLSPAQNLSRLHEILDAVRGPAPAEGPGAVAEGEASRAGAWGGPPAGVSYPWQFAPRREPVERAEPSIHHRAPHGSSEAGAAQPGARLPGSGRFELFINDRADLAVSSGCNLHLTEGSIPTARARALLPGSRLLGRSTHSLEGALQSAREGADFVTFGPVHATSSKRDYGPPQGVERLREVCAAVPVPVFALGGITVAHIAECRDAGAYGVAMIGAIWGDPDPPAALRRCLEALAAS